MNEHQLQEAVEIVLNTRDFCGAERTALKDFAADIGIKLTVQDECKVFDLVNDAWKTSKKDARVYN
jgi:hypothetical protein